MLIAPLNWGLGHATRCIPLIHTLSANGCEVLIAATPEIAPLLREAFPGIRFLPIPGYRVKYSKNRFWLPFKLLLQSPHLFYTIYRERQWLKRVILQEQLDAVISDNRFGLYNVQVQSIFITHQLEVQTGTMLGNWLAQQINYRFIRRYDYCWVPDAEGTPNLAGRLSHPVTLPPVPVKYLGPLSRFGFKESAQKKYDLLVLLSGPEPQRSILETILLEQLGAFSGKILLVRGLPSHDHKLADLDPHIEQYNHLPADRLEQAIRQSHIVLCRSGYTTVMDLVKLQQSAIFIPTPGQREQEYLAGYLEEQGLFCTLHQDVLLLHRLQEKIAGMKKANFPEIPEMHTQVIKEWLAEWT